MPDNTTKQDQNQAPSEEQQLVEYLQSLQAQVDELTNRVEILESANPHLP